MMAALGSLKYYAFRSFQIKDIYIYMFFFFFRNVDGGNRRQRIKLGSSLIISSMSSKRSRKPSIREIERKKQKTCAYIFGSYHWTNLPFFFLENQRKQRKMKYAFIVLKLGIIKLISLLFFLNFCLYTYF